ncbi:hypothetical protein ACGFNP_25075 [Nonomuraea sp. NPDC049269]|uniref:hypothetical protein n=1 Tax=Nonomuraea sp. NPDC049269 TaxID=3364349 RepID=UPI003712B6E5
MSKILGNKKDRDELTAALRDAPAVETADDPRHQASQERIRRAESTLPPLARFVAREKSR